MLRFKRPKFYRFLLLLSLSLPVVLSSSGPCYNHDGSVVIRDTPCRPELKQSFGCGPGWACLDNGICSNHNTTGITGMVAGQQRASCTDPSFPSDQCPQYCPGNTGSGREVRTFENGTFCCVFDSRNCVADSNIISLKEGLPFTTIGVSQSSSTLSSDDASSIFSTASSRTVPHRPAPLTTSTGPAASRSSQIAASAANPTDSTTAAPASHSLPWSTKIALGVTLPISAFTIMIIPLFFWFKRRREPKAAEEAKILSAKQQRPASDAAPLINYAGLGHAPQELDHPKGLDWKGRAELPLNIRTAQAELMGSTAPQELGG